MIGQIYSFLLLPTDCKKWIIFCSLKYVQFLLISVAVAICALRAVLAPNPIDTYFLCYLGDGLIGEPLQVENPFSRLSNLTSGMLERVRIRVSVEFLL